MQDLPSGEKTQSNINLMALKRGDYLDLVGFQWMKYEYTAVIVMFYTIYLHSVPTDS